MQAPVFSAVGAPLPPPAAGGAGAGLQYTAAWADSPGGGHTAAAAVAAVSAHAPLFAEYVWAGPGGAADLRCASRVLPDVVRPRPGRPWAADSLPLWSADADTASSPTPVVFLKARAVFDDPLRPGGVIALCETFEPPAPGSGPALRPTPHNTRAPAAVVCDACGDADALFTITQQYTLHDPGTGGVIGERGLVQEVVVVCASTGGVAARSGVKCCGGAGRRRRGACAGNQPPPRFFFCLCPLAKKRLGARPRRPHCACPSLYRARRHPLQASPGRRAANWGAPRWRTPRGA